MDVIGSKGMLRSKPYNHTLEVVQVWRLIVMFGGQHAGVQKHQQNDDPVECLRLDGLAAGAPQPPIDSVKVFFAFFRPVLLDAVAQLLAQLIGRVHELILGFHLARLDVWSLRFRFNVLGLGDPVQVAAQILFDLLLLAQLLEVAAIFGLRTFF